MNIKLLLLDDLVKSAAFIALYLVLFLFAKWFKDFVTPYKLNDALQKKENLAAALTMSGYYIGVALIFVGTLLGPSNGLRHDLVLVGGYSLLGILLLNLSRWVNGKAILRHFCHVEHTVNANNISVASVQCATYISTGLIAAGAVSGEGGGVISSLVFFILGQVSLFLFSYLYDWLTPYSIQEELGNRNLAAGVAFSGVLTGLGIIIFNSAKGNLVNWQQDIVLFLLANVAAFIFLPLVRLFMDKLVIPGEGLSNEIASHQNLGAGFLEAAISISFALIIMQLV